VCNNIRKKLSLCGGFWGLLWAKPCNVAFLLFVVFALLSSTARADGMLETIKNEVGGLYSSSPSESSDAKSSEESASDKRKKFEEEKCEEARNYGNNNQNQHPYAYEYNDGFFYYVCFKLGGAVISSPFWAPRMCLNDDSSKKAFFAKYPYQFESGNLLYDSTREQPVVAADQMAGKKFATTPETDDISLLQRDGRSSEKSITDENCLSPGYMSLLPLPFQKTWECQVQADYLEDFNTINGISGQILLETTSRWGVKASVHNFWENLPEGRSDNLAIGDCNLVYRVAQGQRGLMRMGLGANWLNAQSQTDFGFNFTYGGDFFPRKPWVISSGIDWGTLGHAGLFRFRTTAGVIIRNFETYVGYEYSDIGTTQNNFFISGVRIWF
jgi:hypothetical protein